MDQVAQPRRFAAPAALGARVVEDGVEFAAHSSHADSLVVCLFDAAGKETARWRLAGRDSDVHHGFVPGVGAGARYGLRADGPWDPARAHKFDPAKLLLDPYATRIEAPILWRPELALPREAAVDTAPFVPRAVVEAPRSPIERAQQPSRPGFVYEVAVKAFTARRPDLPVALRGTIAGLSDPHVVEHLVKLGVTHVELLPIAAYMSERHLSELGLANAWGYNSAVFMALDPRLAPGGVDELRRAVDALREAGVATLLDVVFNHTAESDERGPTLSLRGLDNALYYRHGESGAPINDTGCGNTLACHRAPVVRLIVDALRHYVEQAGVDGFRFDLAATLARDDHGFPESHPLLVAIAIDPVLQGRAMIAEPWDIGPGGYRLGAFEEPWFEWNDRFRDDVRRFWRGDGGAVGDLATRFSGSADVFQPSRAAPSASVNYAASHDGFALRDLVSYASKHNEANGEANRDGDGNSHSWNCGAEGGEDGEIEARRKRDARALLATVLLSRGTPMLTAGDEFWRTQRGNNNAYAQDNDVAWLDWAGADMALAGFVAGLARLRRAAAPLRDDRFLTGRAADGEPFPDVAWATPAGGFPSADQWRDADALCATLCSGGERLFVVFNRANASVAAAPPAARAGCAWRIALDSASSFVDPDARSAPRWQGSAALAPARGVLALRERAIP